MLINWRRFFNSWRNIFGEVTPKDVIFSLLGSTQAEIDYLPNLDPMSIEEHCLSAQNKLKQIKVKIITIVSKQKEKSQTIILLDEAIEELNTLRMKRNFVKIVKRKSKEINDKLSEVSELIIKITPQK